MPHPQTMSPSRGGRATPLPRSALAISGFLTEATRGGRVLLGAGLAMLVALSACEEPDAEAFVRRARDYRETGDISASIIELKNALQQEPRNPQARFLLGRPAARQKPCHSRWATVDTIT